MATATATPAISISQAELLRSLEPLAKVAKSKSDRPILSNIHIWAESSGIRLHATNGTISISDFVYCNAHNPDDPNADTHSPPRDFNLVVPADRFHALIASRTPPKKETNPRPLIIEQHDSGITIIDGRCRFQLQTASVAEFPEWQGIDGENGGTKGDQSLSPIATLPAYLLRDALTRVQFAAGGQVKQYALDGTLIEINPELIDITVVATNGSSLAAWKLPEFAKPDLEQLSVNCQRCFASRFGTYRFLLPEQLVKLLIGGKMLPSFTDPDPDIASQQAVIYSNGNVIAVEWGERTVLSPMLEGLFPNWRHMRELHDYSDASEVKVKKDEMAAAISSAMTVTTMETRSICLEVVNDDVFGGHGGGGCELLIASGVSEVGNSAVPVPCTGNAKPGVKFDIDPNLILPFVNAAQEDITMLVIPGENASGYSDSPMLATCGVEGYEVFAMPLEPQTVKPKGGKGEKGGKKAKGASVDGASVEDGE